MALQIRRGTTAERLSIIPLPGEPIYDINLQTVFVGDGNTPGGVSAISGTTAEDARDITGQMFVDGVHKNIIFKYDALQDAANRIDVELDLSNYDGEIVASAFRGSIFAENSTLLVDATSGTIPYSVLSGAPVIPTNVSELNNDAGYITFLSGSITADITGSIFAENSTLLIDGTNGSLNLNGTVKGDIIPDGNELYDIGSPANKFRDLYLSGTSLNLGSAQITAVGSTINLPAGSTVGGIEIGAGGLGTGSMSSFKIAADDSTQISITDSNTIQFVGGTNIITNINPEGVISISLDTDLGISGDIRGSVFADDSSVIVNSIDRAITAESISCVNAAVGTVSTNSVLATSIAVTNLQVANINSNINTDFRLIINQQDGVGASVDIVKNSNDNIAPSALLFTKSRGTPSSPTSVVSGDRIGAIAFRGFDGAAYNSIAQIRVNVQGAISSGVMPSAMRFLVQNLTGQNIEALTINPTGETFFYARTELQSPILMFSAHDSSTNASNLIMNRSRGTIEIPTAVQQNDPVFDIIFTAFDGTANRGVAQIRASVDGPVSLNNVPGRLEFEVTPITGGIPIRQMVLKNDGVLQVDRIQGFNNSLSLDGDITGSVFADNSSMIIDGTEGGRITTPSVSISEFLQLPVYADDTARATAIPSPAIGMVIFMQSGTTPASTNQPQYFDGTNWQNF